MNIRTHFLPLLGLSTFAIAQPILNTLGHGATFFVSHGSDATDVLSLALAVFIVPPVLFITLVVCVGMVGDRAGRISASLMLGVLTSFASMVFLSELPAVVSIPIVLVLGVIVGLVYFKNTGFRELLQWVGMASPIVPIVFLLFTPVSSFFFSEAVYGKHPEAQKNTPIIFLLFDELSLAAITTPDGQIDAGRLPNFSRLAQLSTWYSNTTTVSIATDRSVPAILTGIRPKQDMIPPIYSEYPNNLFSLLAPTHTISAVEYVTELCPESVCVENGLENRRKFDVVAVYRDVLILWEHTILPVELARRFLPSISTKWGNFDQTFNDDLTSFFRFVDEMSDQNNTERFKHFVSLIGAGKSGRLAYLHLGIPHNPWTYLPDGTPYNGDKTPGITFTHWLEDKYPVDEAILRYSLQVEYADTLLGKTLDALEQSGSMDDTLLIVVSDHGAAFEPGAPRRLPIASTLADIARVPLFIKYPGQVSGVKDDRKIETIDIFPTIADVAQLPLGESVDGQSLIAEGWQPRVRQVVEVGDSFPDFEQKMNQAAASERIYEVIHPGVSALRSVGFGLARQYVGKPLPEIKSFNDQLKLHIKSGYCFQSVDKEGAFLPAYVTGILDGANEGQEVMIALNGIVAGSGMTFGEDNTVSVMLNPRKFVWWKNEVRAFSVSEQSIDEIAVTCGKDGAIVLSSRNSPSRNTEN